MEDMIELSKKELLSLRKTRLLLDCLWDQGIEETDIFERAMREYNTRARALGYWMEEACKNIN